MSCGQAEGPRSRSSLTPLAPLFPCCQDCSVDILPMSDTTCSEPGADGYSYNGLAINAYYQSRTKIRSLLPTDADGVSSSYLVTITKNVDDVVDFKYFAATSDPEVAASTLPAAEVVRGMGLGGRPA